jgi:hypothetical protein
MLWGEGTEFVAEVSRPHFDTILKHQNSKKTVWPLTTEVLSVEGRTFEHFKHSNFGKSLCIYATVRYGFRSVSTLMDITSNAFYKCTATSRTQIYRKRLRIKLNGFRPVERLVDITSNTFYKCTATFRTHCIYIYIMQFQETGMWSRKTPRRS